MKNKKNKKTNKQNQNIRDQLIELIDENETLFCDGFDEAIVGVTHTGRIVYDIDKMIDILLSDGSMMTNAYEEAIEYLEFNTFGAYVGEYTPVYIRLRENIQ